MDVADGFKRSGFFEKPNWKNMLDRCFENKRLGLTNEEIEIYASVLSDVSTNTKLNCSSLYSKIVIFPIRCKTNYHESVTYP